MSYLLMKAKTAPAEAPFNPAEHKDLLRNDLAALLKKPPAKDAGAAAPAGLANPSFVGLLALLKQHGAGGQFGPDTVKPGDEVAFSAGDFTGAGVVSAAGEHGATVADKTAREHRVHWHEVTAHTPAAGRGKKKGGADGV